LFVNGLDIIPFRLVTVPALLRLAGAANILELLAFLISPVEIRFILPLMAAATASHASIPYKV
jgi:hypothetical protein